MLITWHKIQKSPMQKRKFQPIYGISASYRKLPKFKSGIRDSWSSLISSVNFLCPSRQIQGWHHISCHNHYLPYVSNSLTTIQCCIHYISDTSWNWYTFSESGKQPAVPVMTMPSPVRRQALAERGMSCSYGRFYCK
jgi:hypothetical protein